ncbi:unnamed protein product [Chrysodeixis includens]|uniref:FLYWCH-type domain-containing protein n=1 Tax=Chrysodeixis includens TaxID=689277 RepID=A0A9P0BQK5_CHRIL|nr:unnamed protein product [Chrysodeixis includens]
MVYWVQKEDGKTLAIVNGYTFYRRRSNIGKCTWSCTRAGRCRARFMMSDQDPPAVLTSYLAHNHNAPQVDSRELWFVLRNSREPGQRDAVLIRPMLQSAVMQPTPFVKWIRQMNGKELAIVNGYTFYCRSYGVNRHIWSCTHTASCNARMLVINDIDPARRVVLRSWLEHNHEPPEFNITNGFYVKLHVLLSQDLPKLEDLELHQERLPRAPARQERNQHTAALPVLQWVRKKDGKELAVVNGYTFYCHKSNVKTKTWSCTKGGFCKARLIITNDPRAELRTVISAKLEHEHAPPSFIISNGSARKVMLLAKSRYSGKHLVVYNDYTYYCKRQCKKTKFFLWYCSTHNCRGCYAKLKLDENFAIKGLENKHTHPPAKYCIHDGQWDVSLSSIAKEFVYITSQQGKPLLLYKLYPYCKGGESVKKGITRWKCTSRVNVTYVKSQQGRTLLVYRGFSHYYHSKKKKGDLWRCTSHSSKKCGGRVVYNRAKGIVASATYFQFIESRRRGNPLIMHRGYTYWLFRDAGENIGLSRWRCSSHKSKKCRGKLLFNRHDAFVTPTCDHNHPPPKYIIQNGKYYNDEIAAGEYVDNAQRLHVLSPPEGGDQRAPSLAVLFPQQQELQGEASHRQGP